MNRSGKHILYKPKKLPCLFRFPTEHQLYPAVFPDKTPYCFAYAKVVIKSHKQPMPDCIVYFVYNNIRKSFSIRFDN